MLYLIESHIRSFGGYIYEVGDILAGEFFDEYVAQRCADEMTSLCEGLSAEVEGQWMIVSVPR